jgi:ribose transport system permease protein
VVPVSTVSAWARRAPWVWSVLGAIVAWLLIGVVTGRPSWETLTINATLAAFLAFVALGQLLVITGGGGGIDLSIPYVITLSAYWSCGTMAGSDRNLLPGIATALAIGLAVGAANAVVVLVLDMPPIVGTLAVGFLTDSAVNVYASNSRLGAPSPTLADFVRGDLLGVPRLVLVAAAFTAAAGFALHHVVTGRQLVATGQSEAAAALGGVRVRRVRAMTYLTSGLLGGLAGLTLAGFNNSAFLNMGEPYLLSSIGAVVLGGSLIAGGRSTAVGTAGGALFLTLVLTLMQSSKLDVGLQNVGEGLLIIGVLLVAGQRAADESPGGRRSRLR